MPVGRGGNFKQVPLNIVGSSKFGRYPKIDNEHTFNMFESQGFLVPYPGYAQGLLGSQYFRNARSGRGIYSSDKQGSIFAVFDADVYIINLTYNQTTGNIVNPQVIKIGTLQTSSGRVYIAENNKPQILISDGNQLYLYDSSLQAINTTFTVNSGAGSPGNTYLTLAADEAFQLGQPVTVSNSGGALPSPLSATVTYYAVPISSNQIALALTPEDAASGTSGSTITFTTNGSGTQSISSTGSFIVPPINFTPGYITFHDTYFICAARSDTTYSPAANNTWRLSGQNDGGLWPTTLDGVSYVGTLETKPDNTQAVVRFPSRGNMIFVMGNDVTEQWYDSGAQLFPYQRSISSNIDYGCISPATVTYLDELVVWLAKNEKSGPIIMASTGDMPQKITTDGIDFVFAHLNAPQDSEAFLYRKDGHIIYHINFYTDNQSYFYDFSTQKIFQASDQFNNYYSMGQVVFYKNQYFSITKDTGNLYVFDTTIYTYDWQNADGNIETVEVPRTRSCQNIRLPSQDYFILNDVGFTIETGETNYQYQDQGPIFWVTENGNKVITEGTDVYWVTDTGDFVVTDTGVNVVTGAVDPDNFFYVILEQDNIVPTTPRIDFSISYDGGATFGSSWSYDLNGIGQRRNRLLWWQCGMGNDIICQFRFWGFGRFVVTEGVANIRQ